MLMNIEHILSLAKGNNFAVPAFNISSNMLLSGIMEVCEEKQSPLIIAIHPDELKFVRPSFVKSVIDEANQASVPVCIHLDHGSTIDQVMLAIQSGFTSVMLDASTCSLEENISICRKVVEISHAINVTVEGELGTIGKTDPGVEAGTDEIIYTNPGDAVRFVEETGVDALAIAIGTSHGIYPKDKKPELKLDLLKEIKSKVNIPLVLHGGSANKDSEIAEAVQLGISKINISSDIKDAFYKKCREVLIDPVIREPNAIYPQCIAAMKKVAAHKIELFNSEGKAKLY